MITTVNNATALTTALKTAQAGDVIQLASGDYGRVILNNLKLDGVTIASADAEDPARLTGLNIINSTGITVKGIDFVLQGDAVNVSSSQRIVLDGNEFHGTADRNLLNDPYAGVNLRNATEVTIRNSEFHDLIGGVQHDKSDHLTIEGNRFHDIRMDGIRGGGSSWVTIKDNFFTDFYRNGSEHPDMIQFWTTNTSTTTHDIVISDNVFLRGAGSYVQGIFMGNENAIPYEHVTITGNLIVGAQYHGLAVSNAKDVTVTGNTVVGMPGMNSWIHLYRVTGGELSDNVSTTFNLGLLTNVLQSANTTVVAATDGGAALYEAWKLEQGVADVPAPPVDPVEPADPGDTGEAGLPAALVIPELAESAAFTKTIWGTSGANSLTGTAAAEKIEGSGGADTMAGGGGDDTYMVDNVGDTAVEAVGGGVDTVQLTGTSHTLGENVENLILKGYGQSGIGNSGGNLIVASGGSTVSGMAGDDILVSASHRDVLTGGAGHDLFRFDKLPGVGAQPRVTDFTHGEDLIDFRKLLTAYTGSDPIADGWVKVQDTAAGLNVMVDLDGAGSAKSWALATTLDGYHGPFVAGSDWLFV